LLLLALILLLAVWDSERITAPRAEPGRVRVTYWEKWTDFEYDAMKAVVDEFNRSQNRIHVDLLRISDVGNKTLLAIAGGNPPDIAGLWGANVCQYADDHAVLPLDDYCRQYGINVSRYIPVYWNMCNYRGHVYALPSAPHSTALHYNRTLFEQARLDTRTDRPKPSRRWTRWPQRSRSATPAGI
jgi:ABC-type glycerol-3-phosphate transport system substrate-binding protein